MINDEKKKAYLLGYDMCLTPTEYKVLCGIISEGRISIDGLMALCSIKKRGRGNISVHVCSINRKAQNIAERKLILYENYNYYINEFM